MGIATGIILCLAVTLYVSALSQRKWLKILAVILNVLLTVLLVKLSVLYGKLDASIMQGGAAYLVLEVLQEKVEAGDDTVLEDLNTLLEDMDQKNIGGVNGPVMMEYYRNQKKKSDQAGAQQDSDPELY